jgi:alpha-tubulin suppressor-like RCC1 family protein
MGNGERVTEISVPGGLFSTPTVVAGVTGAKTVSSDNGTVIVLLKDGTIRIWGHDGWGQGGVGTSGGYQPKPVKPKLTGIAGVFVNGSTCFAVTADGQLYAWGFGRYRLLSVMKNHLKVPTLLVVP